MATGFAYFPERSSWTSNGSSAFPFPLETGLWTFICCMWGTWQSVKTMTEILLHAAFTCVYKGTGMTRAPSPITEALHSRVQCPCSPFRVEASKRGKDESLRWAARERTVGKVLRKQNGTPNATELLNQNILELVGRKPWWSNYWRPWDCQIRKWNMLKTEPHRSSLSAAARFGRKIMGLCVNDVILLGVE